MKRRTIALVVLLGGCLLGCDTSPQQPSDMPTLIRHARVKVMQDGNPLTDAKVALVAESKDISWAIGGKTDHNGVARLMTHGQFQGAPAGKYKVTVSKLEKPESIQSTGDPAITKSEGEEARTFYDLVDLQYGKLSTTPLTVEISSSSPEATVDVGKPVRIKIVMPKGVP